MCVCSGTSNWSGDYFTSTGGVGLVIENNVDGHDHLLNYTVSAQLNDIFMRDWMSTYAQDLPP
jgi:phospholipase D3/4